MTKDEGTYFKFERLTVWQNARVFTAKVYNVTSKFPRSELFGIANQLRRAASSITLNISEGSERQSDPDFQRFLRMALASINEVVAALYIACDQSFLQKEKFNELRTDAKQLTAQLKSFIRALAKR